MQGVWPDDLVHSDPRRQKVTDNGRRSSTFRGLPVQMVMEEIVKTISSVVAEVDFPDGLSDIAARCSIEDAVKVTLYLPGLQLYIPKAGSKLLVRAQIAEEFDFEHESNASSLAMRLRLDRSRVLALAKDIRKHGKPSIEAIKDCNEYIRLVEARCGRDVAVRMLGRLSTPCRIYVPRAARYALLRRYVEIVFDGTNTVALAAQLGVGEYWIRKVIRQKYEARVQQLSLFG